MKKTKIIAIALVLVMLTAQFAFAGQTTYQIKAGDTLAKIAKQFGMTYQELAEKNGIKNPNLIKAGNKLVIDGEAVATNTATKPAPTATKFKAGTYTGTAKGNGGTVTATVTVTADKITTITAGTPNESKGIGDVAAQSIGKEVVSTQSLALDAITGATVSSKAMLEAVTAALAKAGANMTALKDPANKIETVTKQSDITVDVVIIGSGGAGMTAAVEAKQAGKSVIILEQMALIGGNTNRATAGINAAETSVQAANNIVDKKDTFYKDTLVGGKNTNNPELLRTLVDNAADAVEWLNSLGAKLSRLTITGGMSINRTHTVADGSAIGPTVVKTVSDKLNQQGVNIMLNTTATEIIKSGDTVVGVKAKDAKGNQFKVNAKAVILATGGFGANSEMVVKYRPELKGYSTTNHAGANGSGIVMAQAVGADLTDIDQIQIHPTTDPKTGYMFTEALRGDGAILVNQEGKRFTNELLTRDVVSAAELKQTGGIAYLLVDEALRAKNAALAGYVTKGYATKGETIEELAAAVKMDPATLAATLKTYNAAIDAKKDAEFGRESLVYKLEKGPYYAIPVKPSVHHTMGGLKIDTKTHVIGTDGKIIKGLYAAGEVTGGVHGSNRIGGNAIADIIVFGRIAGQTAAAEIK